MARKHTHTRRQRPTVQPHVTGHDRRRAPIQEKRKSNVMLPILIVGIVCGLTVGLVVAGVLLMVMWSDEPGSPIQQTTQTTPPPVVQTTPDVTSPVGSPLIVDAGRSPIPGPNETIETPISATRLIPANQPTAPSHAIAYTEAPQYLGQEVTVEGVIVDGRVVADGNLNLLYFTKARDNSFYLAMFKEAYDAVDGVPSQALINKKVRVTGPVSLHRGRPQVRINDPDQLTILESFSDVIPASERGDDEPLIKIPDSDKLDDKAPADGDAGDKPAAGTGDAIPWTEAHKHVGKEITVVGKIVNTRNIGDFTFLNFDRNWREHFYVVVYKQAYDDIPGDPAAYYMGKTIKVTGRVDLHESKRPDSKPRPQIKVRDAKQIVVVD